MRHGDYSPRPQPSTADRGFINLPNTDHPVLIHPLETGMDCSYDQASANSMDVITRVWVEAWRAREDAMDLLWLAQGLLLRGHDAWAFQGDLD